jgi:hypothetical protein
MELRGQRGLRLAAALIPLPGTRKSSNLLLKGLTNQPLQALS